MKKKKMFHSLEKDFLYLKDKKKYNYRKLKGKYSHDTSLEEFIYLLQNWDQAAGRLAQVSLPRKLTKFTLYVVTEFPGINLELKRKEKEILLFIKENLPFSGKFVKNIQITNSKVSVKRKTKSEEETIKHQKYHRYSPRLNELKKYSSEITKDFEDDELKELFQSFVVQNL